MIRADIKMSTKQIMTKMTSKLNTANNSFLVVQFFFCTGVRVKLQYEIQISTPFCTRDGSAPIAMSDASVSRMNFPSAVGMVRTGAIINAFLTYSKERSCLCPNEKELYP